MSSHRRRRWPKTRRRPRLGCPWSGSGSASPACSVGCSYQPPRAPRRPRPPPRRRLRGKWRGSRLHRRRPRDQVTAVRRPAGSSTGDPSRRSGRKATSSRRGRAPGCPPRPPRRRRPGRGGRAAHRSIDWRCGHPSGATRRRRGPPPRLDPRWLRSSRPRQRRFGARGRNALARTALRPSCRPGGRGPFRAGGIERSGVGLGEARRRGSRRGEGAAGGAGTNSLFGGRRWCRFPPLVPGP